MPEKENEKTFDSTQEELAYSEPVGEDEPVKEALDPSPEEDEIPSAIPLLGAKRSSFFRKFSTPGIALLIVVILLFASLGGVLFYYHMDEDEKDVPEHGIRSPQTIEHTMNIHIVLVGFENGTIDEQVILNRVPTEYRPFDTGRSFFTNGFPIWQEYQKFYYNFQFHDASDEFSMALFTAANEFSEWGDLGDEGNIHIDEENYLYLKQYDLRPGAHHGRMLVNENVQFIDALELEKWIAGNKANYDLDFGVNSYTYFLIDSWSRMETDFENRLPVDKYHYYRYYEADWERRGIHTMRAWGGDYGFLWLDVGAAPNFYEVVDDDIQWGSADDDPPIWDIGNPLTGSELIFSLATFNDNMARDFHYALNFRFSPSYIYHPTYAHTYYVNIFIYYEDGVLQDEEVPFDFEETMDRLYQSFPWCNIQGEYHINRQGNGDDPGMFQAIEEGKEAGYYTYCDAGPIVNYVETHRDKYYLGPDDAFNLFAGLIQFEDNHYTVAFPVAPQGVAMNAPDGKPWGVLCANNEGHRRAEDNPTTPGAGVFPWTSVTAHEFGHFFGLHHPHDGMMREHGTDGTDGDYYSAQHWLWDQSDTIMSYRTHTYRCDALDWDHLARGHIMENTNDARRNIDIVYEMLLHKGKNKVPSDYQDKIDYIERKITESIDLYHEGRYIDGAQPCMKALEESEKLLEKVAREKHVKLAKARVEQTWNDSNDGSFTDYKEVAITTEMEYIDVTIYWNNTGGDSANLCVGYTFQQGTGGARYDYYQQGAGEANCKETTRIDLDDDGIREAGTLYIGGGSQDDGNNVPYQVVIKTIYRESGLYWEDTGIESY